MDVESGLKRLENYTVRLLASGTPAVEIVHKHDRFELTLRVTPNPDIDVLAIQLNLVGEPDLMPYVLFRPHLCATGYDNFAEVREFDGRRVLAAEQGPFGLALAAVDELRASVMSARATVGRTSTAPERRHCSHEPNNNGWGLESASRDTRPPGEIIPNGGRHHLGIGGRLHRESAYDDGSPVLILANALQSAPPKPLDSFSEFPSM